MRTIGRRSNAAAAGVPAHLMSAPRLPRSRRRSPRTQRVCTGFHRSGARRDKTRRSSWCRYEQRQPGPIKQLLCGNRGASFDRNRVPSSPLTVGQQAALLTIDTACHGVRGVAGVVACLADTRGLVIRSHISVPPACRFIVICRAPPAGRRASRSAMPLGIRHLSRRNLKPRRNPTRVETIYASGSTLN
jgi:hypothetical protein